MCVRLTADISAAHTSVPALTIDIGGLFFGQVNDASASERDE